VGRADESRRAYRALFEYMQGEIETPCCRVVRFEEIGS